MKGEATLKIFNSVYKYAISSWLLATGSWHDRSNYLTSILYKL